VLGREPTRKGQRSCESQACGGGGDDDAEGGSKSGHQGGADECPVSAKFSLSKWLDVPQSRSWML
jgi:hypothetical protein